MKGLSLHGIKDLILPSYSLLHPSAVLRATKVRTPARKVTAMPKKTIEKVKNSMSRAFIAKETTEVNRNRFDQGFGPLVFKLMGVFSLELF